MNGVPTPLALWLRASGRSWWEARYTDGTTLGEWETLPFARRAFVPFHPKLGAGSRWELARKDKMIGLRLLCPNGQVGDLAAKRDHLLFQMKVARQMVGAGGGSGGHEVLAHLIGVADDDGSALCFAWERPGRLVQFRDNVHRMTYQQIGPISLEVQDIRIGATPAVA